MKDISPKKCALSIAAVFVYLFFYDMLVHGYLLKDLYEQTAHIWRPVSDMQKMMPLCFFYHFAMAAFITALYSKFCVGETMCSGAEKPAKTKSKSKGKAKASKDSASCAMSSSSTFGLTIGALMGTMMASAYIHLPIPPVLAVAWFLAGAVQGIGAGVVLCMVNSKCSEK